MATVVLFDRHPGVFSSVERANDILLGVPSLLTML
jgi:hypothetical protein